MSAEREQRLNDCARDRHPGLCGAEVLHCAPELVSGRLDVTRQLVAGRARPFHRGRTTRIWDVEGSDEASGRVIAPFRCTQIVLPTRVAAG